MNTQIFERYSDEITAAVGKDGIMTALKRMHAEIVCELIGTVDVLRAANKQAAAEMPIMQRAAAITDRALLLARSGLTEIAEEQNDRFGPDLIAEMALARTKALEGNVVELHAS